ncbi:Bug family tripartite tricarboxylate transporter substrate binding protein [Aquabacter spiritensis]|uniref:Tripartite-type tricarboxylate transporter receptor subunit TctC n=1 Tax=Aquabacter spiritensis TaxID=933073 RepID=A0A4R3M545_9HYPH|nr:tripartite tricarboxylate transporter substrate binding protein [Aquabacter spiritensis]TCT07703.1 tripartite-type tricarboxylate transporter receptor subunit TctC [Aquabacter spiritensis]
MGWVQFGRRRRPDSGAALSVLAVAALAAGIVVGPAAAEDKFPSREVRLIVPWNAGGSNDIAARVLAPILAENGMRIIVDNVPGGTGTIGMGRVANAEPDGYTIGMGTSSTLSMIAQNKTPLRNDQFASIARVSTDPLMLLVPVNGPKDLGAFMDELKKRPGKVTIGTPGTYNINHIFATMTARAAGVDYVNVPYPGGAKVITDLAGGQIDAAVLKPSESIGQIKAGQVRPIAVFANDRLAVFPDVPTMKEKGYDVFPYGPVVQMAYLVAPAKVSPQVRKTLIAAFEKAIQDPRFKAFAAENGVLVDNLTGEALDREVQAVQKSLNAVATQVFKAE